MSSYNLQAQNPIILGSKYEVKADFIVKDSVLVLSYKNMLPFPQLIWASGFSIAAILNASDVSSSYLASTITQEIYLVNKKKEAVNDPPTTHRLSKLTLSNIKTLF